MADRARSKAGGSARQVALSVSRPGSISNGRPQAAQAGPSIKLISRQQLAQRLCGSPPGPRQTRQSGGRQGGRGGGAGGGGGGGRGGGRRGGGAGDEPKGAARGRGGRPFEHPPRPR